jgi:hypothetical protein
MRRTPFVGICRTARRVGHDTGGSLSGAGVRRLGAASIVGVALMAVVAAPGALAAGQQHDHFRDLFTDVDDDFCGTGQRIDIAGNVLVNEWHAPHKGDFKQTASGKITVTNPLTGDTAVSRFAGPPGSSSSRATPRATTSRRSPSRDSPSCGSSRTAAS